jgi:hypothetical protein
MLGWLCLRCRHRGGLCRRWPYARNSGQVDGPDHGSIGGIDDGNLGRLVTEDVYVIVKRIVEPAVRITHDFDGLDRHQHLGIEHLDRLAADKSMARLGGYHDSVRVGAGDVGLRRQCIQIKDGNAGRVFASTRNIQAARI